MRTQPPPHPVEIIIQLQIGMELHLNYMFVDRYLSAFPSLKFRYGVSFLLIYKIYKNI